MIWAQQLVGTTYSTSVVDWATEACFSEDQQMREDPGNDKYQKCSFGQSHNMQN
jgi:hypothetical protein